VNSTVTQSSYNPRALVGDVVALLTRAGVAVPLPGSATAVLAAADLLRALGVRPATAPEATEGAPWCAR
jgi:hypothetical protein